MYPGALLTMALGCCLTFSLVIGFSSNGHDMKSKMLRPEMVGLPFMTRSLIGAGTVMLTSVAILLMCILGYQLCDPYGVDLSDSPWLISALIFGESCACVHYFRQLNIRWARSLQRKQMAMAADGVAPPPLPEAGRSVSTVPEDVAQPPVVTAAAWLMYLGVFLNTPLLLAALQNWIHSPVSGSVTLGFGGLLAYMVMRIANGAGGHRVLRLIPVLFILECGVRFVMDATLGKWPLFQVQERLFAAEYVLLACAIYLLHRPAAKVWQAAQLAVRDNTRKRAEARQAAAVGARVASVWQPAVEWSADGRRQLYSPNQAFVASLLGSVPGLFYVMYKNAVAEGNATLARRYAVPGICLSVLFLWLGMHASMLVVFSVRLSMALSVRRAVRLRYFNPDKPDYVAGYCVGSNWRVFGTIGKAVLFSLLGLMLFTHLHF